MSSRRSSNLPRSSVVPPGPIEMLYLQEPLLVFGDEGLHVDPKSGIARYGPRSLGTRRHPSSLRVGLIGTSETIETTQDWIERISNGVLGNDKHPEFPGYKADRGFFSSIEFDRTWNQTITQSEVKDLLTTRRSQKERFDLTVGLLDSRLHLISDLDLAPQYVVIALPYDIARRCRVADYQDPELGGVHRDLRRAVKALAMRYRLPTQIVLQGTTEDRDPSPKSRIAWNFMTGMYFKAGGVPWAPHALQPGTCYIGVSFYRPLGSRRSTMQTSLVQAFDEHGEGLVLRGHEFEWDSNKEGTSSPHLSAEQSNELVRLVLNRYEQEMKQRPGRVVVHKKSRYWPAEREGFETALAGRVASFDLMALAGQSTVRLLTAAKYPPLRGTRFSVGDLDFLYTTGFISELNEFHALHVPAPLQVADHVGQDTSRVELLREVLALTKMNWNSANLGGLWPITLRFSERVGEILREMPAVAPDIDPLPQFKFYM